ncbi:MAG: tetratricopeptide repeat protein [Planctomycetota bacterium]
MSGLLALEGARANDLDNAKALLRKGDYEKAIAAAREQVDKKVWNDAWPRLLIESYLTIGEHERALVEYEAAIARFGDSIRLRLLGVQVYRMVNNPAQAGKELDEI